MGRNMLDPFKKDSCGGWDRSAQAPPARAGAVVVVIFSGPRSPIITTTTAQTVLGAWQKESEGMGFHLGPFRITSLEYKFDTPNKARNLG